MKSKYWVDLELNSSKIPNVERDIEEIKRDIKFDIYQINSSLRQAEKNGGTDKKDTEKRINQALKTDILLTALKNYLDDLDQKTISKRKLFKNCKKLQRFLRNYEFKKDFSHKKRVNLTKRSTKLLKN